MNILSLVSLLVLPHCVVGRYFNTRRVYPGDISMGQFVAMNYMRSVDPTVYLINHKRPDFFSLLHLQGF